MTPEFRKETEKPTLENLLKRLHSDDKNKVLLLQMYREVASGIRDVATFPLPRNVQVLAAQAMVILLETEIK